MLDIGWAELFVVGVVALLVVGPKEMLTLLRVLGRYVGMIKRQASEFRAQFDEAIKDTEIDSLRKDVESIKSDAASAWRNVETSARIDPDAEIDKRKQQNNHAPNFAEDELDWMRDDVASPAARAAAAASAAAAGGTAAPVLSAADAASLAQADASRDATSGAKIGSNDAALDDPGAVEPPPVVAASSAESHTVNGSGASGATGASAAAHANDAEPVKGSAA